ncbi:hypothetical protein D3C77_529480 [compost metagenome]
MELDFHPAVFIAEDFFAFRPGDTGGLADQHRWACDQRWPVEHVPGQGLEGIAIALAEAVFRLAVVGDRLLQHLRLLAFVGHTEQ